MAMIGMLVLGLLIGIGLAWQLDERKRATETAAREALHAARLKQLQEEVFQADSAHAETKERLISLQLAQTGQERLAAEAEAWRTRCETLERELALLRPAGGAPPAGSPAAATRAAADDLTKIRGIGQVMQRRLGELGIMSFRQLAELTPAEVQRINGAIEFPGRIERERWVEQARRFLAR